MYYNSARGACGEPLLSFEEVMKMSMRTAVRPNAGVAEVRRMAMAQPARPSAGRDARHVTFA